MKIIHLIFSLQVGGAENLLVDIANEQAKTNDVSIVLINNQVDESLINRISYKVKCYRLGRKPGNMLDIYFLLRLWFLILKISPTIIHCHNHNNISLIPFWRHRAIITVHDLVINTSSKLRWYRKAFSISNSVKEEIEQKLRIQSTVIYNGINFSSIKKKGSYRLSPRSLKLVQVGRLEHLVKGQHIAIKAVHALLKNFDIEADLFFVGEGPSEGRLKQLCEELQVEDRVHFFGKRDRQWVNQNLSSFDILLQPSLNEGFGLALLEAIAAGLPVVSSRTGGPLEILQGLPSADMFEAEKADALAQSISKIRERYLQSNIEEACRLSYEKVYQKYSISNTAKEYLTNYQNLQHLS